MFKTAITMAMLAAAAATTMDAQAQQMTQASPGAGNWKTWVIRSGDAHGVPPPPDAATTRGEMEWLRTATRQTDPRIVEQIRFWNSGPPSYRWMDMVAQRQISGRPFGGFPRSYAYVSMAIHDATVAAWNAKQTYRRLRPTAAQGSDGVEARIPVPGSYSYPSEHAATAAAAAAVMAYLVPEEAAAFEAMAEEAGKSRLWAGVEYPSDYFAGMELGRRVAEQVIRKARADGSDAVFSGAIPTGHCMWTGTNPGNVTAAQWRPLLLTSPGEFRPAPPPSCDSTQVQADLAMLRSFPRALTTANLFTNARALYWQTPEGIYPWAILQLGRWLLEDNMEMDAPWAARAYALVSAAGFDAFIASQDGKYTYWYLRPAQLDPSIAPLFPAPNFPSYPSNHSTLSTARAEVMAYLFPGRAAEIRAMAKEAGDSRIWAGIHFEMDNQAGVKLGQDVARKFIEWAEGENQ